MIRSALLLLAALSCAAPARAAKVLLVTGDATLTSDETARRDQFVAWGHTVTTIVDSNTQANFNTAMAAVDVVYVPGSVQDWELLYKVRLAACGVVAETPGLDTEIGFVSADGYTESDTQVTVANNTHEVTTGLATGLATLFSSAQPVALNAATPAAGMQTLAQNKWGAMVSLGVIDIGGALANTYNGNSAAVGRRVRMPWADITWSALDANGLTIAQQAIAWAAVSKRPLLHWKLDETAGSTVGDSSGNNHHGAFTGTHSWVSGRRNGAADIVSGAKASVSNLLGKPTSFTVAAWVDCDSVGGTGGVVVSVGDHIALVMDEPTNGGKPAVAFNHSGTNFRWASGGTAAAGQGWRHYVGVFDDAANTLKLYVDGVLVATTNTTDSVDWAASIGTTTTVGGTSNAVASYNLDGRVDDVRVYGRALSAKEIAEVYGLVGWWKFDETSGSTAYDSSGAGNHATHTGGTPQWVAGRVNNAIELDGTDRYLTVSTIADSLNGSDGFSAAVWVKSDVVNNDRGVFYGQASTNTDTNIGFRYDKDGASGGAKQCIKASTMTTTANPQVETGSYVQTQEWQHLTMTWRSGSAIKFYVNGVEQTATYATTANGGVLKDVATLHIGTGGYPQKWDGKLDDLRIYNRAIGADEVAAFVQQGFVGHWKLNETGGTTAADSSPTGNDGTYTGGVTLNQAGPYPGVGAVAADFDGNDDYVAIPNENLYDITGPLTVAVWFKVDEFDHHFQTIVAKGDDAWRVSRDASTAKLHFACSGLTNPHLYGNVHVDDGGWHHVAGVYDGSKMRLYVDGQLDVEHSCSGTVSTNDHPVTIGKNAQVSMRNWEGGLFDLRLYSYALSAAEVADLYGLVGHWKLDETSGTVATDSSGKARHGTYQGSPTLATAGPKAGSVAAQFDGNDDRVSLPIFNDKFADGVTIAGWMRPTAARSYGKLLQLSAGTNYAIDLGRAGTSTGLRGIVDLDGESGSDYVVNGALHDNVWRHYTMTMEPSGTMRLYRNGVLLGSAARLPVPVAVRTTNWIGASNWSSDEIFKGGLYDVRVYNRPASDAEVAALYFGGNLTSNVRIVKWQETANP